MVIACSCVSDVVVVHVCVCVCVGSPRVALHRRCFFVTGCSTPHTSLGTITYNYVIPPEHFIIIGYLLY